MTHSEFRHRDDADGLEQVLYREAGGQAMPPPAVSRAIRAAAADAVRPSWPVRLSRWLGLDQRRGWSLAAGSLAALVLAVSLGVQVWQQSPGPALPGSAGPSQPPASAPEPVAPAARETLTVPAPATAVATGSAPTPAPAPPSADAARRAAPAPSVPEVVQEQRARAVPPPPPIRAMPSPPPAAPAPAPAPVSAAAPAAAPASAPASVASEPSPAAAGLLASLRPGLSRDQVQSLLRQAGAQPEAPLRTRSAITGREADAAPGEAWRLSDGQRLRCRFLAGTNGSEGQGERLEGCRLEP